MVYVTKDGAVHNEQPWGLSKVMGFLNGFFNMIFAFFQTMIPIEGSTANNNFGNNRGYRSGGGGGGGGGGSGGGGRPWGNGRPGSNIRGLDSILPPPSASPCAGGACGRR